MEDLRKFILRKQLEKLTIEDVRQSIIHDPYLSKDTKYFWLGFLEGASLTSDVIDSINLLLGQ